MVVRLNMTDNYADGHGSNGGTQQTEAQEDVEECGLGLNLDVSLTVTANYVDGHVSNGALRGRRGCRARWTGTRLDAESDPD